MVYDDGIACIKVALFYSRVLSTCGHYYSYYEYFMLSLESLYQYCHVYSIMLRRNAILHVCL